MRDDVVVITGMVDSEELRQAAFEVVKTMAPDLRIVDNLEISSILPENIEEMSLSEAAVGDFPAATPETGDTESLEPGDFTDQDILTNPLNAAGPSGVAVDEEISEGEEVYVPPTDPVRERDGEVLGGFQTTSMDQVRVPRSADGEIGDEAIAEAVRRELREDAATSGLEIYVQVRRGRVLLRGAVPSLDDAENAEEVASRVEGVNEVVEELDVNGI
jgi:osmotically-inducible protein OsmY